MPSDSISVTAICLALMAIVAAVALGYLVSRAHRHVTRAREAERRWASALFAAAVDDSLWPHASDLEKPEDAIDLFHLLGDELRYAYMKGEGEQAALTTLARAAIVYSRQPRYRTTAQRVGDEVRARWVASYMEKPRGPFADEAPAAGDGAS